MSYTSLKMVRTSAISDVFNDYIFYPFIPNVPFQYPGIAKLSHRSKRS